MAFTDLLNEQERKRQEQMMQAQMLQGMGQQTSPNVMMQNVPTMMQGVPNMGQVQQQDLTGEQQTQLDDIGRSPIRGMKEIMSADTPTLGTALAKTLAAGVSGHYGRKEQAKEKAVLKKALKEDANKTETERLNDLRESQRKAGLEERRVAAYEANIAAQSDTAMTEYQKAQVALKKDYYEYLKTKGTGTKPMTENQIAIRTEKLEKKLDPIQGVVGAIDEMDKLLAPYAKGGSQSGDDVPGLGFIEGQRGIFGDVYRLTLGSEESRNIQAAMQELTSERIRERAGLTQTLTETQSVLRGMAQQDFSDEKAALNAYGRVRAAYQKDITRLRNSTNAEVLGRFEQNYENAGQTSPLAKTFDVLSFPQAQDFGEDIPTEEAREADTGGVRDLSTVDIDDMTEAELVRYLEGDF